MSAGSILVVGSINADIIIEVDRMPKAGETITSKSSTTGHAVCGGKGANQAVAAARLSEGTGIAVQFVGQFGSDTHAKTLESAMVENKVDISRCGHNADTPSGQGFVFLGAGGAVSSIVVGGSNVSWPAQVDTETVAAAKVLMLQREVPEHVNEAFASAASAAGVQVIQDMGGEDRPISDQHLKNVHILTMNKTELERLTSMPTFTEDQVLAAAKTLQGRGATNILVTLGEQGALLIDPTGCVTRQPCCPVPGGKVVDETSAGDSFKAGFAVGTAEGRSPSEAMRFGAAAGAIAVSRMGAVPSLPFRKECQDLADANKAVDASLKVESDVCPMKFASRLNSMKDRRELWTGANDVFDWVMRQGTIKGLDLVDFNFPQHLGGCNVQEVKDVLAKAGLGAGAICMRYPKEFELGAFTNPNPTLRQKAIDLTKQGCQWALDLGAEELVVWSAYDGYDYSLQVDYPALWARKVGAFQEICDAYPMLRVSLEYKPTDENTRFFAVPSTGASMCLVHDVARHNFGLTLDIGHCLMAGENPAQSAAMVGSEGKLFGVQLNDGYGRLGAEDGLMFGSVNPRMALEFILWLQKTNYKGHIYFDTFPQNNDPVREAEYNIRRVKDFWAKAKAMTASGIDNYLAKHDVFGALEMMETMTGW